MKITTTQILSALDLKRNTFQDWMDRELIVPSIQKSSRQGEPNIFSMDDVYRIELFRQLLPQGFTRGLAAMIINNITFESVGPGKEDSRYLVCTRGRVINSKDAKQFAVKFCKGKGAPTISFQPGQYFGIVVDLLTIKESVDKLFIS